MKWDWLRIVAGVGLLLQGYFAYQETLGWGPEFVADAAPAWVGYLEAKDLTEETRQHIAWAENLADNMGVYNLVLAIGLAWVAIAGATVASSLGIFLAVWLLVAAAAAGYTEVYKASIAQGLLGLALLFASVWALRQSAEGRAGVAGRGGAFRV